MYRIEKIINEAPEYNRAIGKNLPVGVDERLLENWGIPNQEDVLSQYPAQLKNKPMNQNIIVNKNANIKPSMYLWIDLFRIFVLNKSISKKPKIAQNKEKL